MTKALLEVTLTPMHVRLPAALVRAEHQSRALIRANPGDPELKELHLHLLEALDAVEVAMRVAARVRAQKEQFEQRLLSMDPSDD